MWLKFSGVANRHIYIEWDEVEVDEFFVEIAGHEYSFKEDKENERFIISETTAEKDKHFKK